MSDTPTREQYDKLVEALGGEDQIIGDCSLCGEPMTKESAPRDHRVCLYIEDREAAGVL